MDSSGMSGKVPVGALIGILVAVMVGIAVVWFLEINPPRMQAERPPPTPEIKAYARNLQLSDVQLTEAESFTGSKVIELSGRIRNAGDRTLKFVELTCIFLDVQGHVVARERLPIVRRTLKPEETRDFRLPFDNIPPGWNQSMPQLVIAYIEFE